MATNIYDPQGRALYYADGNTVHELDGKPAYYIADGVVYSHADGKAAFYIYENWVYSYDGRGRAYFGR